MVAYNGPGSVRGMPKRYRSQIERGRSRIANPSRAARQRQGTPAVDVPGGVWAPDCDAPASPRAIDRRSARCGISGALSYRREGVPGRGRGFIWIRRGRGRVEDGLTARRHAQSPRSGAAHRRTGTELAALSASDRPTPASRQAAIREEGRSSRVTKVFSARTWRLDRVRAGRESGEPRSGGVARRRKVAEECASNDADRSRPQKRSSRSGPSRAAANNKVSLVV